MIDHERRIRGFHVYSPHVFQIKSNIPAVQRVTMGSDNCSGQNKNGLIIRYCGWVVVCTRARAHVFCYSTLCGLASDGENVRHTTTEEGHGKGVWDGEGL